MGVKYYMYAPKDNVIYDVGKLGNWEQFKPFLTWAHTKWILLHENEFDWYPQWWEDQNVKMDIQHERYNLTFEIIIPKDVEKRSCFSYEFKSIFDSWKVSEQKRQEKIKKWREEDERIAQQTPEEKQKIVERIMNELYPGDDRTDILGNIKAEKMDIPNAKKIKELGDGS